MGVAKKESGNPKASEEKGRPLQFLSITDEPSVHESLKMILAIKYHCDILTANDYQGALDIMALRKIDLVFMHENHIQYNGKRAGLELLKTIKDKYPTTEVLMMSSFATDSAHTNSIALGAIEYLRIPFVMEEIYEIVERMIKMRKLDLSHYLSRGENL